MSDRAFEYAKELTLAALQSKEIHTDAKNGINVTIATCNFFETVYKKLKELEPKSVEK